MKAIVLKKQGAFAAKLSAVAATLVAAMSAAHAQAVTIDSSNIITRLASGEATIQDIGVAFLSAIALVAVFKLLRRAF